MGNLSLSKVFITFPYFLNPFLSLLFLIYNFPKFDPKLNVLHHSATLVGLTELIPQIANCVSIRLFLASQFRCLKFSQWSILGFFSQSMIHRLPSSSPFKLHFIVMYCSNSAMFTIFTFCIWCIPIFLWVHIPSYIN